MCSEPSGSVVHSMKVAFVGRYVCNFGCMCVCVYLCVLCMRVCMYLFILFVFLNKSRRY